MKLGLEARQAQRPSPQTLQYMRLLSMSTVELYEFILEAQQENPVLEFQDEAGSALSAKFKWLVSINQTKRRAAGVGDDCDILEFQAGPERGDTLFEHLARELRRASAPEEVKRKAIFLASCLDPNGFLDVKAAGPEDGLYPEALALLQDCEPAGVGARGIGECIRLQLDRSDEDTELAMKICGSYLEDVAASHYHRIAASLKVPQADVFRACAQIRSVDCRPGGSYGQAGGAAYIFPDVIVDENLTVTLSDESLPPLCISGYYSSLAKSGDPEVSEYLENKLRQAKWVLASIDQRRATLLKCASAIVGLQREFFSSPSGRLSPMRLSDIADLIGIHESTVSRAIRDKYIQSHYGQYALASLFTSSVGTPGPGAFSSKTVRDAIKELISGEDKKRPLSDQRLADSLAGRGICVSRRAVAKYRSDMGIRSASGRKAGNYCK